jgi:PhnB protein
MEEKMLGVKPYLAFGGNCEEAINFYKECLGGEILYIGRYGDSPMKGQGPGQRGDALLAQDRRHSHYGVGQFV